MRSDIIQISVDDQRIGGTLASPSTALPGVLFVHGWGGSQEQDLKCSHEIAALGCVCLTFDLRGHADTNAQRRNVSREQNLSDVLAAYDVLTGQTSVDSNAIGVVGSSYGGYLSAILTSLRPVRWLALRVPALYRDRGWQTPKADLDRKDLTLLRNSLVTPDQNRALAACAEFEGDALVVESEHDDYVPHSTITNYVSSFRKAHSITYRIIEGADHALTDPACQRAYDQRLVKWMTEMVQTAR
jgi:dienelactone hydrolase